MQTLHMPIRALLPHADVIDPHFTHFKVKKETFTRPTAIIYSSAHFIGLKTRGVGVEWSQWAHAHPFFAEI